ncbi:MAG: class I SAM-dependent methyltransferase [Candidatus Latescibacteria bacterium]|nr:class I SAM-dependent methyltransferase [Candidatus Latescibacterota bacterium]
MSRPCDRPPGRAADELTNPWLGIPLDDYEGHMALPDVGQARLLSDVFADALARYAPRAVAVLGCAGGNGFERVTNTVTERVVGVDLNPGYIEQARLRFGQKIARLELFVGDVQTDTFGFAPVDLVYAGLLFEYVAAETALARIRDMLRPGGTLVTVVQLPSAVIAEITPSPYASLGALAPLMRLVPPEQLGRLAEGQGFREAWARTVSAADHKSFRVLALTSEPATPGP